VLALLFALTTASPAQDQLLRREGPSTRPGTSREELNAKSIIDGAVEAFRVGQNERGVKALQQVAKQYPGAKARFRAWSLLGEHFTSRRNYEEAIVELEKVIASDDDEQVSAALCRIGTCHYEMNAFDQAVAALRQVINKYPGSTATNDAYYYIGMCHYHRKRWGKALQAFEMVGTSVADREDDSLTLAEAGRRLFIRVRDKDLPVLDGLGEKLLVEVTAGSGDSESVPLEAVGRALGDYVASVRATTETSEPGDGVLRVRGSDTVTVSYVDKNTEAGEAAVRRLAEVRLVSTAGLGITDGAYRQRVPAVAVEQPIFVRLKDLDLDATDRPDEVRVKLIARYKVVPEEEIVTEGSGRGGVDLTPEEDRAEWIRRSSRYVTLQETSPTSGLFVARVVPTVAVGDESEPPAGELTVRPGDVVEVQYVDAKHLRGEGPMEIAAEVLIVETGSPALENMVTVSSDPDIQARKLLLEAQLRQMLAKIFYDMGLVDRAAEKSNAGLERVDEILKLHAGNPLSRHLLERAFEAKWNLYLAQGDVQQAIATCRALLELVPDTSLADQAFLKIGQAYYDTDVPAEVAKAIPVLQLVIDMEGAAGAPEASLLLADVHQRQAGYASSSMPANSATAHSIAQYMKTAELFPDSPQAAEALKKVVKYHYERADYPRTAELLERVCQDYQDQEWLHKMLLTWGVVHLRMNQAAEGVEKLRRVIEEYPESDSAETASKLLEKLRGEGE